MLFSCKTDLGKVRQINQDYFIAKSEKIGIFDNIFMVADGVGSNMKSGYASKHACDFILQSIKNCTNESNITKELERIIHLVNTDLYYRIIANAEYSGMGTTLVIATVKKNKLLVANVGDSRCYHIRDEIIQITKDHSMAEELVRENIIKRNSVKYIEYKSQLTRAIGAEKVIKPDFYEVELKKGDYILLCTDGLSNMLTDKEIFNIIMSEDLTIEERVNELINDANDKGGRDNICAVLIYIDTFDENDIINKSNYEGLSEFAKAKLENNQKVINELYKNNLNDNEKENAFVDDDIKIYDKNDFRKNEISEENSR